MRILLDTHTLLWHYENNDSLSLSVKNSINDSANQLFISVASIWEVSIKTSLGKLKLETSISEIIAGYAETGTTVLSISLQHAVETSSLPWHHRDPFDRMLVAQARLEDITIATCDERIRQYDIRTIW